MKILNVIMLLDPVSGGGTAERTYQLSRSLVAAGCDCTILTTDLGLRESRIRQLECAGVDLVALPCILPRLFLPLFSWKHLRDLIASFDIVHIMNHWTVLNALVHRICLLTETPYVVCPGGTLEIFGR